MQFSFPAAKILQKLHICKHSDIFCKIKSNFIYLTRTIHKNELFVNLRMDFLAYIDFFS